MCEFKEQSTFPPEPVEVAECAICHGAIYADQEYYLMEDFRLICDDCLAEWASDFATAMCNGREVDL